MNTQTAARILVVGRHPTIMTRVRALLESAGYETLGTLTDEEALRALQSSPCDALLLGGGVETSSRAALSEAFRAAKPGRPVIEHFGGPDGLLDHVRQALASARGSGLVPSERPR